MQQNALSSAHNVCARNGAPVANPASTMEFKDRVDVLLQENEELAALTRDLGAELTRLREEKLAQTRDHMIQVRLLAAMRDEFAAADVRARHVADSRDHARDELQACAGELLQAQEYTQQAMAIAARHAADRDAEATSLSEHRALLNSLNASAASDREALMADLAVARADSRDMRERANELSFSLKGSTEREQALMERLSGELNDKAVGARALHALESRCAEAEARIAASMTELSQARCIINELSCERNALGGRAERGERLLAAAEAKLDHCAENEKTRRDALTTSLRREASGRSSSLKKEVHVLETKVADLQHQLTRASRQHRRTGQCEQAAVTVGNSQLEPASALVDEVAERLSAAERERDSLEQLQRATVLTG